MKKGFIIGMAMTMSIQGAFATVSPTTRIPASVSASDTSEEHQKMLHEADILAAKILVQMEYLRLTQQINIEKLAFGDINDQTSSARVMVSIAGVPSTFLLGSGLIYGVSHAVSFQKPGVYIGNRSNISTNNSSITYEYTVTWKQAYGPFALAGGSALLGAGSLAIFKKFIADPNQTELGKKLMGFDSKLHAMLQLAVEDLSNVLDFSSAQKRAFIDATTESVVRQIAENKDSLTIDLVAIAKSAGLLDENTETALKNIAAVSQDANSLERIEAEVMEKGGSLGSIEDRIKALKNLETMIKDISAQNQNAEKTLKALSTRAALAARYLERMK